MFPTIGTANGLSQPYEVGQSGTASPASWLVTDAPATISTQVPKTWRQAKPWRHARCAAAGASSAARLGATDAADAAAGGFTNLSLPGRRAAASPLAAADQCDGAGAGAAAGAGAPPFAIGIHCGA